MILGAKAVVLLATVGKDREEHTAGRWLLLVMANRDAIDVAGETHDGQIDMEREKENMAWSLRLVHVIRDCLWSMKPRRVSLLVTIQNLLHRGRSVHEFNQRAHMAYSIR